MFTSLLPVAGIKSNKTSERASSAGSAGASLRQAALATARTAQVTYPFSFTRSQIQFTSQVLPPSVEKACSKCGAVGL